MDKSLQALCRAVQQNCHISDAAHARSYTLCTYLLKMREYYRWEKGYPFSASLPKDELGDWLEQREQLWEELESSVFAPLRIGEKKYTPFDSEAINRALLPQGLIYSGGYGSHLTPHFFLGTLARSEQRGNLTVQVSDKEFARDLSAPPAMMRDTTILIRRESLRRLLWERIEEWQWRKQESAMARAVAHYGFEQDASQALEQMTDHEIDAVILHELGEARAGEILGPEWPDMLLAVSHSRAELMARAVRDHLADCLTTLPALVELENAASLHFYFANLKGMRRELFPQLLDAYQHWLTSGSLNVLEQAVNEGREHWTETAQNLVKSYRDAPANCAKRIIEYFSE
jgi:hypothetical protein